MQHQTEAGTPAPLPRHKLILCTTPRSASTTLAAHVIGAGLGNMREYFLPDRTDLPKQFGTHVMGTKEFDPVAYCDALLRNMQRNGIFSVKIFFSQLSISLLNQAGKELFDNATVVYLLRTNPGAQAVSFKTALETQLWTAVKRQKKHASAKKNRSIALSQCISGLCKEDRNWRKFFAYAGINPLTITDRQVIDHPLETVTEIAARMGVDFDREGVMRSAAKRHKYELHADRKNSLITGELTALNQRAFDAESYRYVD